MFFNLMKKICLLSVFLTFTLQGQEFNSLEDSIKHIINGYDKTEASEKAIAEFKSLFKQIDDLSSQSLDEDYIFTDRLLNFNSKYISLFVILRFAVIGKIDEILENFDPSEVVYINMVPPGGGYPSGIAASEIKEPVIREKYQKMLQKNAERVAFKSKMNNLISLQKLLKWPQERALQSYTIEELQNTALPMVKVFLTQEKRQQEWETYIKELIRKKSN